ncbi:MAG: sigma-E factor negative regulatory protein [Comamonas sp.]
MTSTENATSIEVQEQLSALVDGELDDRTLAQLLARMEDGEAQLHMHQSWQTYHLIGASMRQSEGAAASMGSLDFLERLNAQLALEQPLSAPQLLLQDEAPALAARPVQLPEREAANQSVFRWKMVAGLASLAVVSLVGWNVLGTGPSNGAAQQIAANTPMAGAPAQTLVQMPVTVGQNASVMLRDPRLDELLAARGQIGGTANLQMPAGFLRNATFAAEKRSGNCADQASRLC